MLKSGTVLFLDTTDLTHIGHVLSYAAPLYVDMKKTVKVANPHHERNKDTANPHDMFVVEDGSDGNDMNKIFIGMVPIMLKSTYCMLTGLDDAELQKMNESQYEQVTDTSPCSSCALRST